MYSMYISDSISKIPEASDGTEDVKGKEPLDKKRRKSRT
jgi:hypothetical protein